MEISLALSSCSSLNQPETFTLDHPVEFSSNKYFVKENGSGFVCVHDHVKAVLFEVAKDCFNIIGVFFFRRSGFQHAFTLATSHGIADFEVCSSPKVPSPSADTYIVLSSKHLIDQVEFFHDTLLIGTIDGSLGIVLFREPKQLKGCFVDRNTGHKGVHHWGFCSESNLCAILSQNSIAVCTYQQEQFEDELNYNADIEADNISSITIFKQHNEPLLSLVIHYTTSQDLILISLPLADCATISRENISLVHQPRSPTYFLAPGPQSFVGGTHNVHILATLLPDSIHFGTIHEAKYENNTTIPNDANVPFEFGHWQKRRSCSSISNVEKGDSSSCFAAIRSDGICVVYDVKSAGDKIEEIYFTYRLILPFIGFCFSPLQESNGFISVAHCDLVCSPSECDRSVQVQRSFNDVFLPLRVVGFAEESSLLLLLEVVLIKNYYAFVYLLKSGECFSAVYNVEKPQLLAFEEHPYDVTSILYFLKDETAICILGFNDGTVKVFTGGKLSAVVPTSHCGPIDRIATLHDYYAYYAEIVFASISSCMGTICFHSVETGEVLQTFVSPSRPLTSCYLDRSCEYLLAFSRLSGNLWHLQSCSLERTFVVSEKLDSQANMGDLMAKTWTSSMRIKALHFLGRRYFSICVNIEKLIVELQSVEKPLRNFIPGISLLLDCCITGGDASPFLADRRLSDLLEGIPLKPSSSCGTCAMLGAMRLLYALLDSAKDAKTACEAAEMSIRLHKNFSKCSDESDSFPGKLLCDFFFTFYTDLQFISAAARRDFQLLVRDLTPERVLNLSQSLLSDNMLMYQGTHSTRAFKIPLSGNKMYAFVSALLVESGIQAVPNSVYELQQRLITPVLDFLKEWFGSSKSEPISFASYMALLAFSEGFPIFSAAPDTSNLVLQLIEYTIKGACEESRHVCMKAVSRIIFHNASKFIEDYCVEFSAKHPRWNAALIKIFTFCVVQFPCKTFYVCDCLLDFSIKLIAKSFVVDEKDATMGAMIQLVRTLTTFLPNVSFHAHSQRIAVGTSEGIVKVYSLKNEGLATFFNAHPEPILSLAFSTSKADYELVTVSQTMKCVKVWRTLPQSISLMNLFSRSSRKFKLFAEFDLPDVEELVATELLMVRFCRIRWLSPECVQFESPWHGKVQNVV